MATKNTKDVELNISTTTSGTEQLQQLSKQLRSMADSAGDAAPEFKQLAEQVDKLAEQSTVLRRFEELNVAVTETGNALAQAKVRVEETGNAFRAQEQKVAAFKAEQEQARAAVAGTEQALREAKAELNTYKANADAASRATVGYKDTLRDLRNNVAQLENTLNQQKALVAKKSEVNALESELRKLGTAYQRAEKDVASIENTLSRQKSVAENTGNSLRQLGVAFDSVNDAQAAVQSSAQKTTKAIADEKAAFDYLAAEVRDAEAAERELAAVNALEKKRQEAIQMQRAAEYVQFWTDALNKAEDAERQLALEAKQASEALSRAFAATGVRSAEAIRAEIDKINAALMELRTNSKVSGAEFDRAFASAKERIAALDRELKGLPSSLRESNVLVGALKQGVAQLTAAYGAFELGRGVIDSINKMETLRRSLAIITGSTQTAAQQIQFLQSVADKAGLSYNALAQDFVNFSAAANTSGIALEQQRAVFLAVANAAGALGISTDRVGLILQAFAQTASKGKVTLEELQGQLGESLPGALAIVANGLGVTNAELLSLVKNGIDVRTFFDAFVKGSKQAFGDGAKDVESFAASLNRLKNQAAELAVAIGDSGVGTALTGAIKGFGVALGAVGLGANTVFESVFTLVRQIATGIAAIVNRDFKGLGAEMERLAEESFARQAKAAESYRKMIGLADESAAAQKNAALLTIQGQAGVAQATNTATASVQQNATAQASAAQAAQGAATAQTNVAAATTAAGTAAAGSTSAWAQQQLAYVRATEAAANQITIAEKLVQAKGIEGKAREQIAKLSGDEAAAVQVAAEASRAEVFAIGNLISARQQELDLFLKKRAQLLDEIALQGDASGAKKKEVEELNNTIKAREAEIEKTNQAFAAARAEADVRELAVKTYKDNSTALNTLKTAYEQSQQALAAVTAAQRQGLATQEQVNDATKRAAQAEALYRDALADTARATDLRVRSTQSLLSISEARLAVERQQVQNDLALAQSMGNTYLALDRQIRLKEIDLKMSDAKITAIKAEIGALQLQIDAEEAALKANDPLLEQKRAEIQLRRENLKLKEIEIDRLKAEQVGTRQVIDNLRLYGNEAGAAGAKTKELGSSLKEAGDAGEDAMGRIRSGADRAASSIDNLASKSRSLKSRMDSEGFSTNETTGQRVNAELPTWLSSFNTLKGYGLSEQQASQILKGAIDGKGNLIYTNNPLQQETGASTFSEALRIKAEQIIRTKAQYGKRQEDGNVFGGSTGSTHKVEINIGGRTTTINTASEADSAALTGMLQQLEREASRA